MTASVFSRLGHSAKSPVNILCIEHFLCVRLSRVMQEHVNGLLVCGLPVWKFTKSILSDICTEFTKNCTLLWSATELWEPWWNWTFLILTFSLISTGQRELSNYCTDTVDAGCRCVWCDGWVAGKNHLQWYGWFQLRSDQWHGGRQCSWGLCRWRTSCAGAGETTEELRWAWSIVNGQHLCTEGKPTRTDSGL